MAQWRKVIVSGSDAILNHISASGNIVADGNISASGNIVPATTDGSSLGTATLNFSDLFLDSGAVINFDNGDATLTHSSGKLTFGGDGTVEIDFNNHEMTNVDIDSGTITGITDLAVADGGTGASTFTDGGILLGSGTDAITAMSALGDGEMIVGDGSTDPVAESGATLRTSIGVGTGDSPQFTGLTLSGDLTVQGGDVDLTNAATDIDLIDNNSSALSFDASGTSGILEIDTTNNQERVAMAGALSVSNAITGSLVSASSGLSGSGLALDTALEVQYGGIGASSLTDKAVLISQDSGVDAVGALDMSSNGAIVIGGTSGPAVEAGADVAGTGLDASAGDGTLAINVAAAQTSITSIINSGLGKIGTDAAQEYITFGTSDEVNVFIDNTERLSVTATGIDVTGAVTISGNLDVNGTLTTIDSSNTTIADKFMILASGSTSDTDGGIIVQNAAGAGYALGYDSGIDRWVLDADLAHNATDIGPDAYMGTIQVGTGHGDSVAVPTYGGATNGVGTIYIDTDDSEIWIYA